MISSLSKDVVLVLKKDSFFSVNHLSFILKDLNLKKLNLNLSILPQRLVTEDSKQVNKKLTFMEERRNDFEYLNLC